MISYAEAKALQQELQPEYNRHLFERARLRDFWHGRYWDNVATTAMGIGSLFRDITSVKSDIGPDFKLVRNLAFDVCVKYQSFLSQLPMIRTFVERPDSRNAQARADLKERVLYATWSEVGMNTQLNKIGWFGPLMGDSFLGIWPDFDRSTVRAVVRSPEHAYPVPSYDGEKLDAIIFAWKTSESRAKRTFPGYRGSSTGNERTVEVLEYSDTKQFVRFVGTQQVNGVEHDLGFNLFDQIPFIKVPGEPFNHGAVEQSIMMIEAGNALWSLEMQNAIDNVFPRLVLEDPYKFSETIDTGPGAVIPVNPGGKAYYLTPGSDRDSAAMLQEYERAVKQDTSMPDASFGQFDASIITGKAINALQGAGTGSLVEMVQGTGTGIALESFNEKALTIYRRMFADDTIMLEGVRPESIADLNPKAFSIKFKGKEIVGSPKNEVVFSPYIDQHGKLVMALQAQGAGLTSKRHGREQIGITDSEQMQEEIISEALEEAVVGALIQALQAEATPENADRTQAQAVGFLEAAPLTPGAPGVRARAPAPAGGGPPVAALPGGGQVMAPALQEPPGAALASPAPGGPTQTPGSPATQTQTLQVVQRDLSQVQGLTGRVWLVGEIAAKGQTQGQVDVAVTAPADRQTIASALPQYQFAFHVVQGQPQEQAVEVTPSG